MKPGREKFTSRSESSFWRDKKSHLTTTKNIFPFHLSFETREGNFISIHKVILFYLLQKCRWDLAWKGWLLGEIKTGVCIVFIGFLVEASSSQLVVRDLKFRHTGIRAYESPVLPPRKQLGFTVP